ncbi:hypothetical protein EI77_01230 [Prosthecobacter fusiformis]|uniref:Uncharacterized protein n=1 Tax=Prosthecobacter fusiformis TaxID=48464 RepID=A0A4R7S5U1_9BACT|nr:hypothetical protein [Prosthecobacter fusiformis]TDU72765.1 hypothetical protein EI77_01230 [Prosthecobacter fusiformis]
MAEDDIDEPPVQETNLDDAQDSQINRMAGCARMGKWMVMATLAIFLSVSLYRCATGSPGILGTPPINLKTKATMKDVQVALGHYRTEYGAFPTLVPGSSKDVQTRSSGDLIVALLGEDEKTNPRLIKFLAVPVAKNGKKGLLTVGTERQLTDAWGERYHILLDADLDNHIANPEAKPGNVSTKIPPTIAASVIIYSSGPDRDPNTWEDNICSWR